MLFLFLLPPAAVVIVVQTAFAVLPVFVAGRVLVYFVQMEWLELFDVVLAQGFFLHSLLYGQHLFALLFGQIN